MIIFRYLCKELYANLLAIILVLLIIFITNQFVHYLKDAASGLITMTAVMQVMSLQIPLLLGYLLPLGLYLAILLAFGRLYIDSEVTVMSACGMSWARLFGYALAFAAVVMVIVAVLMLWLEPIIQGYRTQALNNAVTKASIQKIIPKHFKTLGNEGVFYVGDVSHKTRKMSDVFFAQHKQVGKQKQQTSWDVTVANHATEAEHQRVLGRFLVFDHGYRYIGVPGQKAFQTMRYRHYGVKVVNTDGVITDWPLNASTWSLWKMRHHNAEADATLQWRLAMPISVIIFALLAVPLSRVNPRQGRFAQLVPAIIIYIGYADLLFLGRAWINRGTISPELGLWWIHGLALLIAIALIIYKVGWQRILQMMRPATA